MKSYFFHKFFAVVISLLLAATDGKAQCTPDTSFKTSGVTPLILPNARVGVAYNQVLQFYITKDTAITVPVFGSVDAVIDSFTITKIVGYPKGLTYQCNTSNCGIKGGTNGCVKVSGTPTEKGMFPITIFVKVKATAIGISQTVTDSITSYYIIVDAGASALNIEKNESFNVFPNPTSYNEVSVFFESVSYQSVDIKILDLAGKEILNQTIEPKLGANQVPISISQLTKGVYFIQMLQGGKLTTRKLIKS